MSSERDACEMCGLYIHNAVADEADCLRRAWEREKSEMVSLHAQLAAAEEQATLQRDRAKRAELALEAAESSQAELRGLVEALVQEVPELSFPTYRALLAFFAKAK